MRGDHGLEALLLGGRQRLGIGRPAVRALGRVHAVHGGDRVGVFFFISNLSFRFFNVFCECINSCRSLVCFGWLNLLGIFFLASSRIVGAS